jgi:hypothetical protein
MDTDDLRASINAAEEEVTRSKSSLNVTQRRVLPWKALTWALVLFLAADWAIHHKPHSSAEDDLNHMMQQARHEMIDFYDRWKVLPTNLPNPALRPYISIEDLGGGRFRLEGRLGDATQTLEGP